MVTYQHNYNFVRFQSATSTARAISDYLEIWIYRAYNPLPLQSYDFECSYIGSAYTKNCANPTAIRLLR